MFNNQINTWSAIIQFWILPDNLKGDKVKFNWKNISNKWLNWKCQLFSCLMFLFIAVNMFQNVLESASVGKIIWKIEKIS